MSHLSGPPVPNLAKADECLYCGRPVSIDGPPALRPSKEHLIPVSLGGAAYGRLNVIRTCAGCNAVKNNRTPPEMRELARLARRQAEMWEAMADRVEELVDHLGLLAPWSRP